MIKMNFKRHIFDELVQWKTSSNAIPLILRGARQVGKRPWFVVSGKVIPIL